MRHNTEHMFASRCKCLSPRSELRDPVSTALGFGVLAQRVYPLLRDGAGRPLTEQERTVLKQAEEFLRSALNGQRSAATFKLSTAATTELAAAIWIRQARAPKSQAALSASLKRLEQALRTVTESGQIDAQRSEYRGLVTFFKVLSELAQRTSTRTIEVVRTA